MLVLIGVQSRPLSIKRGDFFCPHCRQEAEYREFYNFLFFILFFLPLFPLWRLGRYVECQNCQNTYDSGILEMGQVERRQQKRIRAAMEEGMLQMMVRMMLVDDVIELSEVQNIQRIYRDLTGQKVDDIALNETIRQVSAESLSLREILYNFNRILNDPGREKLYRALCAIASADGEIHEAELDLLHQMARTMGLARELCHRIEKEVAGRKITQCEE